MLVNCCQSVSPFDVTRGPVSIVRILLIGFAVLVTGCDARQPSTDQPAVIAPVSASTGAGLTAGVKEASGPATSDEARNLGVDVALAPSFRPPDQRLRHDATRLSERGIHEYASRRLILYSDIEPEIATLLPPLIDQVFEAWETYFGPLPPARDGSDFQLTGFLMRDQGPFRQAGLLPVHLPPFAHGKHDAQQFWMNDSEFNYYRRHLMIHEATHCFMQSMGGTTRDVPVWYLEGMAEHFATHTLNENGTVFCGVMPDQKDRFVGFGRILMIQRAVADGRLLNVDQIASLQPQDFVERNESYAWAWALCHWAYAHPHYGDKFRQLSRDYVQSGFQKTFDRLFGSQLADFDAEWTLFARHVCYGFDIERATVVFVTGVEIDGPLGELTASVRADRGWQSTGIAVNADESYTLTATGRTAVAQSPQPWESEAQGISIRYNEGRPVGRLLGMVISEPDTLTHRRRVSDVIDLGARANFTVPYNGTLSLRVNDFWNELTDNTGEYAVNVRVNRAGN